MEISKRSLVILCLGWLTFLTLSTCIAGYYYLEFQKETQLNRVYVNMYNELMENYINLLNEKQNLTGLVKEYEQYIMHVNVCIDYREWNGTVVWYNNTVVSLGCNLLQATETITTVNYTYWPAYQASFVDAINGVWNQGSCYWMWYRWDAEKNSWVYGGCGADRYTLINNETIMWRYEIPSYP